MCKIKHIIFLTTILCILIGSKSLRYHRSSNCHQNVALAIMISKKKGSFAQKSLKPNLSPNLQKKISEHKRKNKLIIFLLDSPPLQTRRPISIKFKNPFMNSRMFLIKSSKRLKPKNILFLNLSIPIELKTKKSPSCKSLQKTKKLVSSMKVFSLLVIKKSSSSKLFPRKKANVDCSNCKKLELK